MKLFGKIISILFAISLLCGVFVGCKKASNKKTVADTEVFTKVNFGLKEPEKQIDLANFVSANNTGANYFSAKVLQGLINKTKPRVYISSGWIQNGVDVE